MFAFEEVFRPRTMGLIFLTGVVFFFVLGWICLSNYDTLFSDDRHIMQGVGIFVLALVGLSSAIWAASMWFIMYPRRWLWLIYKHGWKLGRTIYKRQTCSHQWRLDPTNSAKRHCTICKSEQWVVGHLHPSIGSPAYTWEDHNWDEIRLPKIKRA